MQTIGTQTNDNGNPLEMINPTLFINPQITINFSPVISSNLLGITGPELPTNQQLVTVETDNKEDFYESNIGPDINNNYPDHFPNIFDGDPFGFDGFNDFF